MNDETTIPPSPSITQVIQALQDDSKLFPVAYLNFFSDIGSDHLINLKDAWQKVSENRKITLLQDLEENLENDTLVNFDDFALFAVKDPNPRVREQAIRLFWDSENHRIIPVLVDLLENDNDYLVKATSAEMLGHYELLAVLEEIPQKYLEIIENALWKAYHTATDHVICLRCLESLGYSEDERVSSLINKLYTDSNLEFCSSALIAMGRSADNRWQKQILNSLEDSDLNIKISAIRAAGDLELKASRVPLVKIIADEENESDLRYAAIWALSNIGGKEIKQYLEQRLEQCDDEEESDVLEEALDNIVFIDDLSPFELGD